MLFKFLIQKRVLFYVLLILAVVVTIIFMQKPDKHLAAPEIVTPKTLKVAKEEKKVMPLEENNPTLDEEVKNRDLKKKIDIMGEDEPFVYVKPQREISEIMAEQKKLETFSQQKTPTKSKEDFKFDYKIGLEDDAAEKLKSGERLNSEMFNGKIEFSKSF